jgi:CelD/BcsL family acetyltransferase involved in cellulose biosynthesis
MSEAELIVEPARLEELQDAWDALSVANAEPMSGPAWMLGWWRHAAPPGTQLRVVAVRDRGELIGIAPFYLDPVDLSGIIVYRLLTGDFSSSVTPLAQPDRAWDVAQSVSEALAQATPRPDIVALAPLVAGSPWVTAIRELWPGRMRPLECRYGLHDAPTVSLAYDSYEEWLSSRSANFRSNARRRTRQFQRAGGIARLSDAETVLDDIQAFARLHAARWEGRGSSRLATLSERLPSLLGELAQALLPEGRFRLWVLELDGEPICTDLSLAAGRELVGVNVGWDERFRHLSPPQLSCLHRIEHGIACGDRHLSLGRGVSPYKLGFADGNQPVAETALLPGGARLGYTLGRVGPRLVNRRARANVKRALSEADVDRLRTLRRRLRGQEGQ